MFCDSVNHLGCSNFGLSEVPQVSRVNSAIMQRCKHHHLSLVENGFGLK